MHVRLPHLDYIKFMFILNVQLDQMDLNQAIVDKASGNLNIFNATFDVFNNPAKWLEANQAHIVSALPSNQT